MAVAFFAWHGVRSAVDRSAFDLGRGERRYVDVARFVASHTDPDAVILSLQHSGSLRLYADRLTLRYDVLDPLWLDRVVAYLQSIGRRPYFVLDGGEVEAFRQRFGAVSRAGALDWPPLATLAREPSPSTIRSIAESAPSPLAIASTRVARAAGVRSASELAAGLADEIEQRGDGEHQRLDGELAPRRVRQQPDDHAAASSGITGPPGTRERRAVGPHVSPLQLVRRR